MSTVGRRAGRAVSVLLVAAIAVGGLAGSAQSDPGPVSAGGTAASQPPATAAPEQGASASPPAPAPARRGRQAGAERVESIVGYAGSVYALASDHSGVYQWSGVGTHWYRIGGPAQKLYAGSAGLFAVSPETGRVHEYEGSPDKWSDLGDGGAALAVGRELYRLSGDRSAVHEWNGSTWVPLGGIGGPVKELYAGHAGLFAVGAETGRVHAYGGAPDKWSDLGDGGAALAVSGELYRLSGDRSAVHEWNGSDWVPIGGRAKDLYTGDVAGSAGLFATSPDTGRILRYDGTPHQWSDTGGPGATFLAADKRLLGVSPNGRGVYLWSGNGTSWKYIGIPKTSPATREEKLQRLEELTQTGPQAREAWLVGRGYQRMGKGDRFGFRWDDNSCSYSPDKPAGFDFRNACARHDFGYNNYKDMLGEEEFRRRSFPDATTIKARVDNVFLEDMQTECKAWSPLPPAQAKAQQQRCLSLARMYYDVVAGRG
ncbi:hypothetical protein E2651_00825 [Streptomyces sp. MZ04]|nr:hypothetical protein E2651_00825 [Streptomyces sp. MZ04]